ncbi:5'-nucleotidase (lipoprotein e(P4) family) [Sphingomonas aurantiaca]|uniref:5'-nucleotidase (Lipoprotein e(P4) family) n=1 Tax=Sphingomonas aurantiaca TaxID=185949 RepID=A0A2T5GNU3_9SPHN|nr:5'-nucleotidase (lipoprotein e(P4) family) [Sphingomonas aurantiaca]
MKSALLSGERSSAGSRALRAVSWAPAFAGALALQGCVSVSAPTSIAATPTAAVPVTVDGVPAGMQYLYASGEAAAVSIQAWNALVSYVRAQRTPTSVVLAPGASLAAPSWTTCGTKPKAAVFDVDETVLLNLGFEYDAASGQPWSDSRWQAWERTGIKQVAPVPGAMAALTQLRAMGVTVVFNTNRSAANAAQTQATIEGAGLGPARHGETLFLSGDDATGSKKDGRRATIAAKYCVVAMGGDQLGDFSDLFNVGQAPAARRAVVQSPAITAKWGAGWFVLPNPVYGTALKGSRDEVFPPNVQWAPTGGMR